MNPSRNNSPKKSFSSTPPPPYNSIPKNARVFISNIPINQSESTSSERTYQRVNESISSFQFLPSSSNNNTRDKFIKSSQNINYDESVKQINTSNINVNIKRKNKAAPVESSFNEGLERIELSLQQLIDEAQESLKTGLLGSSNFVQQTTQKLFQSESEDENPNFVRKIRSTRSPSYRRSQHLYRQSQERLNVAFQQLDESVQNISSRPNIVQNNQDEKKERKRAISSVTKDFATTTTHHIYNAKDQVSPPDKNGFSNRKYRSWLIGLVILIILSSIKPLYKIRYDILFIALSITLYRRKKRQQNKNYSVVNIMDRLVIRLALRKETPSILGWAHRANFMFRFSRVIRAIRW